MKKADEKEKGKLERRYLYMKTMEEEKSKMEAKWGREIGQEKWNRLMGSDDIRLGANSRQERDIELIFNEHFSTKEGSNRILGKSNVLKHKIYRAKYDDKDSLDELEDDGADH